MARMRRHAFRQYHEYTSAGMYVPDTGHAGAVSLAATINSFDERGYLASGGHRQASPRVGLSRMCTTITAV